MAKKANLNVSVNVDTSGYAKSWDEAVKITQGATKDVEKEAAKMALAVSKKIEGMSIKSQARQLENLAAKMAEAGLAGTKAFTDVARSAGRLKADIDDTKGIINAFRPDAPFNALNATLGAGAQAFAGVQGAMALFGGESENLQKTLLKVQAAMAFAEGFKAIDGLQDGFTQLNLIIKANPLIAGATFAVAIIGAITALTDSTEKLSKEQILLNEVTETGIKNSQKEYGEVQALTSIILDETASRDLRSTALQELQDKYPDYLKNLSIETSSTQQLKKATDELTAAIVKRATVQAAFDKLKEVGAKKLNVELAKQELEKDRLTGGGLDQAAFQKSLEGRRNFVNGTERLLNEEISILTDYIKKQDALVVKSVLGDFAQPTKSASGNKKDTYKSPFQKAPDTSGLSSFGVRENKAIDDYNKKLAETPKKIQAVAHEYKEYNAQTLRLVELNKTIANSIAQIAQDSLFSFGSAIGEMLGGSETAMQDFGDKLLSAIASFMEGISKAMIATAIASEVFQKTLFANPAVALAAGVALAIGAGFVKQQLKGGVQGTGFAEGGIIGGNSPSGDRLLAPVNSGEMIFNTGQQNQLLKLANGNAGGFGNMELKTSIRKNELIVWLDKGNSDLIR